MISVSHWGMFSSNALRAPPAGYEYADHNILEWAKAHGVIEIVQIDPVESYWNFRSRLYAIAEPIGRMIN